MRDQKGQHLGLRLSTEVHPPYTEHDCAWLSGEGYFEGMSQDEVLTEQRDAAILPHVRTCLVSVRNVLHGAHRKLGHPRNQSLVRLMRTARCQVEALAYTQCLTCPACLGKKETAAKVPKSGAALPTYQFETHRGAGPQTHQRNTREQPTLYRA